MPENVSLALGLPASLVSHCPSLALTRLLLDPNQPLEPNLVSGSRHRKNQWPCLPGPSLPMGQPGRLQACPSIRHLPRGLRQDPLAH